MPNLIQKLKQGSQNRSVLIVDDDNDLARSLGRILEMFFARCVIAHDGEEALAFYKKAVEDSSPFTLVVTDLELPKKGGLSLIKEIRQLSKEQAVLIISAHDASDFMAEAISLDVKGYILKPVAMPKLFEHLEKILFDTTIKTKESLEVDDVTHWGTKEKLEQFLDQNDNDNKILLRVKVNHLSNIYNLIGAEYADEYLKELALLVENLQIDSDAQFYRLGLDELVILLEDKTLAYANTLAKNIVSVARYFHISENGIIINSTLSIGIAQGSENLLQNSKLALDKSNESGSGFVVSYTQEEHNKHLSIASGREVMKMIYKAIENDSIIPYVQPAIGIRAEEIKLFNSYVRIVEEEKIYSPETFLNIAQNAHQMSMITRSMIKNTLALAQKKDIKEALLIIYLSNEDFHDESLLPYILFWSKKYDIEPSRVAFEISHIDFLNHDAKDFSLLQELKKAGYQFVLNNFGLQGYNLAGILELEPQYIKLHADLLKMKDTVHDLRTIIQKIIDIIHLIGAKAIATHVATHDQLTFIKTTSIDYVQGYHVCAPYEVKNNG